MHNANYKKAISLPIFETISAATIELEQESYVIGGYVRDYLLERQKSKDIDIVAVGSGIDLAHAVAKMLPGKVKVQIFKNYGTAHLQFQGMEVEFVGARKESYVKESRNPKVGVGTLKDDQDRRDFTINAMALSLNREDYGRLLDPFDGFKDLKDKLIRTPLDPDITFSDDPLRMMRAIRFSAQLGFVIDRACLDSISRNASRIEIVSQERVVDEMHKILLSEKPSVGLRLLEQTGLLPFILPELTDLKGVECLKGQKHKDNFYHTLQVVDNIAHRTDNLWLRWAALLHDIGKAPTKKFDKKSGWTFHGHEYVGSKMVKKIFKRLRMPMNEKMKYVQKIVMMSSRPVILADDVTDSAVRRLIFDAGDDLDDLMTHCEADITTKNPAKERQYLNNFQLVRQKIREVEERDQIRNFQPPISGELIMETFNLKPCKEIGIIKDAIKEAILEGEIANDYGQAYDFMLQKAGSMGLERVNS